MLPQHELRAQGAMYSGENIAPQTFKPGSSAHRNCECFDRCAKRAAVHALLCPNGLLYSDERKHAVAYQNATQMVKQFVVEKATH